MMFNPYRVPEPILCPCGKPALQYAKRCINHIITSIDDWGIDFSLDNVNLPPCLYRRCDMTISLGRAVGFSALYGFCWLHNLISIGIDGTTAQLQHIADFTD